MKKGLRERDTLEGDECSICYEKKFDQESRSIFVVILYIVGVQERRAEEQEELDSCLMLARS